MKTIISTTEELYSGAADRISELLGKKPDALLAISAGRTMAPLFDELCRRWEKGELSLKEARLFAVTEFENAPEELSCRRAIERGLLERSDLRTENCRFMTAENCAETDEALSAEGGIDLAILGLGDNAHIGFNEPATPFDSLSHRQKLTDATRRQNAAVFGGEERVPGYGFTMGIKTLCEAREILLLAAGEEKAKAVFQTLYARTDSAVPAAFLQLPPEVTVLVDREAGAKL